MQENFPFLVSVKPLNADFAKFNKIPITSQQFTLGRALDNAVVIAFLAISRKHCIFKKINDTDWTIEDFSAFGIHVNNVKMKKGIAHKLSPNDTIQLDATGEFVYRFTTAGDDDDYLESPPKRIKLEQEAEIDLIKDVKMKFAESQSFKVRNIEDRIQCAKDLQNTSLKQKQELEAEMETKMKKLKDDFAIQIENLKGEKSEVEKQKQLLENERDLQIENVRNKMGDKINELMEQIQKHNETEEELLKENAELKNKLLKEREDFLEELNRETSSKQELLKQLEDKIKEQEELRMQEREKTERLQQEKEKELKELEDQKKQRELELKQELNQLKENLTSQVTHIESEKLKAEKEMNEKMEQMKKLSEEDKLKMEQLQKERAEAEKKLMEAQQSAKISLEALSKQVQERETQLAALAADRIQKHAEQSGVVITSLQEQLEKVKSELQSVETEKNTLLESICHSVGSGEGTSTKEATLLEVGELMESELQCSICSELFMCATTLNCSHTFCRYCIGQWKKKKLECPICRATITSECKSLVLDSFIEKMVEMSTEMKNKRASMLKDREEEERAMTASRATTGYSRTTSATTTNSRASSRRRNTTSRTSYSTRNSTPASQVSQIAQMLPRHQIPPPPPPATGGFRPRVPSSRRHPSPNQHPITSLPSVPAVVRQSAPIATVDLTTVPSPQRGQVVYLQDHRYLSEGTTRQVLSLLPGLRFQAASVSRGAIVVEDAQPSTGPITSATSAAAHSSGPRAGP